MNAIYRNRFASIAQALAASEEDRQFINKLLCCEPGLTAIDGRRIDQALFSLYEAGIDPASKPRETLDRLIDNGVLHKRGACVSLFPFPLAKEKKKKKATATDFCVYCKRRTSRITRDHVVPRAQGGSNSPANVVTACLDCNRSKGNRTVQQWAVDILNYKKPVAPKPLRIRDRIQLAFQSLMGR